MTGCDSGRHVTGFVSPVDLEVAWMGKQRRGPTSTDAKELAVTAPMPPERDASPAERQPGPPSGFWGSIILNLKI